MPSEAISGPYHPTKLRLDLNLNLNLNLGPYHPTKLRLDRQAAPLLVHSAVLSAVLSAFLCRGRPGRRLGRPLLPCACLSIMRFDSFGELGAIEWIVVVGEFIAIRIHRLECGAWVEKGGQGDDPHVVCLG